MQVYRMVRGTKSLMLVSTKLMANLSYWWKKSITWQEQRQSKLIFLQQNSNMGTQKMKKMITINCVCRTQICKYLWYSLLKKNRVTEKISLYKLIFPQMYEENYNQIIILGGNYIKKIRLLHYIWDLVKL